MVPLGQVWLVWIGTCAQTRTFGATCTTVVLAILCRGHDRPASGGLWRRAYGWGAGTVPRLIGFGWPSVRVAGALHLVLRWPLANTLVSKGTARLGLLYKWVSSGGQGCHADEPVAGCRYRRSFRVGATPSAASNQPARRNNWCLSTHPHANIGPPYLQIVALPVIHFCFSTVAVHPRCAPPPYYKLV